MDVGDLWIGDRLIIKSSGKEGTYEGLNKGRVRIRVGPKILLVKTSNVILAPDEPEEDLDLNLEEDSQVRIPSKKTPAKTIKKEIDLHLEKLPPFENTRWQSAVEYQVDVCRRFMTQAVATKTPSLLIIHGKGKGVLKQEILHLLDEYKEVYLKLEVNKGGAIEVWMQY